MAKVYPELVAYDNDGQPYTVRYQYITTMLLNEVQKQYHRAEAEAEGNHGARAGDRGSQTAIARGKTKMQRCRNACRGWKRSYEWN